LNSWEISKAASIVSQGGVIAYPTEAVYGLGCSAYCQDAVEKILRLKFRKPHKGLILVGYDIGQFNNWIDIKRVQNSTEIMNSWPGPVTWIIPVSRKAPTWITGNHPGIAIRISAHPVVRSLTKHAGILVSTSANPSMRKPARTSLQVRNYFGKSIEYIIPGTTDKNNNPTEIRDAITGQIIRSS